MAAVNVITDLKPETPLPDALKLLIKAEINKLGAISDSSGSNAKRGIRDPDVIHDIRVSARRLQTILESIGEILPTQILNEGKAKIKEIIKALGKARENDVSIDMIRKFVKKAKKKSSKSNITALALLIAHLQKETNDHREEAFSDSNVTDDIKYLNTEYLKDVISIDKKLFRDIKYLDIGKSLSANGLLLLPRFYDRVVRLGKIALGNNGDNSQGSRRNSIDELHKMRIKAKPLRYTMEFFSFAYGAGFAELVKEVKDFVETLGEIHDKDILLEQLVDFRKEIEIFNQNAGNEQMKIGLIDKFIKKLKDQRVDEFKKVRDTFNEWISGKFREKLIMSVS